MINRAKPKPGRGNQKNRERVAKSREKIVAFGSAGQGKQNENGVLTERQRRYVNALVRLKFNHTAAAREAGFSPAGMNQALASMKKNPKIQKAIAIEQAEFARASAMSKKKVIDGLMEAIDMARIQADPTPMIQGWMGIAKMCGYMEPTKHKVEVSVNGNVVIQKLQQLDDHQLLALAEGESDVLEGEFEVLPG